MKPNSFSHSPPHGRQYGVVLFIALIALVAMSLAAVALIRSVDTSTLIAGNLAFSQSATTSGDGGLEAANIWLVSPAATAVGFDNHIPAEGYYANYVSTLDVRAATTWGAAVSKSAGVDGSGNAIRYIIQRMCRNAGPVATADCLRSEARNVGNSNLILDYSTLNDGNTIPGAPLYRITAQVTGARNTISYIQAFVY
jgi:Tfp pilus assembly protein PilX